MAPSERQARFERRWWRRIGSGLFFLLILIAWLAANPPQTVERPEDGEYTVERVVDGDTLLLTSGVSVRLQGIDTPETVRPNHPVERWGHEASEFTAQFIDAAENKVRLSFGAERIDRYGRWLAFVWKDGQMLNEQLVRAGLAEARLDYRYAGKMKRRLKSAQDEARAASRGMWSPRD